MARFVDGNDFSAADAADQETAAPRIPGDVFGGKVGVVKRYPGAAAVERLVMRLEACGKAVEPRGGANGIEVLLRGEIAGCANVGIDPQPAE